MPINKAFADINRISDILNQGYQRVPDPVGCDLVLIDSENGLMWYLTTQLGKYDVAQNAMIGLEVNNWKLPSGQEPPKSVGSSVSKDLKGFKRSSTMPGWRVPELSELQALYKRVEALGGGEGESTSKTLSALKALGFKGLKDDSSKNYRKFWFNDALSNGDFKYYDMSLDKVNVEPNIFFNDPLFTCVLVRSLGPDVPRFGDTGDQYHRGYGLNYTTTAITPLVPSLREGEFSISLRCNGIGNNIPNSDLTDRATWTLENVNPPDVAFLTYTQAESSTTDTAGQNVPQGASLTNLVFRGPGRATVKARVFSPVASQAETATLSFTNTTRPTLEAISISPQNMLIPRPPQNGDNYLFKCTGHLATGETVDLTNVVTWSIISPIPAVGAPPRISDAL